jgi:hypothetical protein
MKTGLPALLPTELTVRLRQPQVSVAGLFPHMIPRSVQACEFGIII